MEANMDGTQMNQMHMGKYMHNAFWHEDQVCITFQIGPGFVPTYSIIGPHLQGGAAFEEGTSTQERSGSLFPPTFKKMDAIKVLKLDALNNSDLLVKNHFRLSSFRTTETLRPAGSTLPETRGEDDLKRK